MTITHTAFDMVKEKSGRRKARLKMKPGRLKRSQVKEKQDERQARLKRSQVEEKPG